MTFLDCFANIGKRNGNVFDIRRYLVGFKDVYSGLIVSEDWCGSIDWNGEKFGDLTKVRFDFFFCIKCSYFCICWICYNTGFLFHFPVGEDSIEDFKITCYQFSCVWIVEMIWISEATKGIRYVDFVYFIIFVYIF